MPGVVSPRSGVTVKASRDGDVRRVSLPNGSPDISRVTLRMTASAWSVAGSRVIGAQSDSPFRNLFKGEYDEGGLPLEDRECFDHVF